MSTSTLRPPWKKAPRAVPSSWNPLPLPEPGLGVVPPERWFRLDAKGEELAAVGDLGVRVDECREVALAYRTQHDLVPSSMLGPCRTFPKSSSLRNERGVDEKLRGRQRAPSRVGHVQAYQTISSSRALSAMLKNQ